MKPDELKRLLQHVEQLCRERGVRLTAQRRQVLELLCRSDKPLTAYELLDRMHSPGSNPAPPTVYRALEFLQEQGFVHKIESLHAFVGCSHPDHPHAGQFLICTDCGGVSELDSEALSQSLQSLEKAEGFHTKKPVIELLGTCAACTKSR